MTKNMELARFINWFPELILFSDTKCIKVTL